MIPFFMFEIVTPPFNLIGLAAASAVVIYAYVKVHRTSLPALVWDAKRLSKKAEPVKRT
jgi:hypothetical protein